MSGIKGLHLLDEQVMHSKNLRSVLPIRLIALGGYISVTSLGNRESASAFTYSLDPEIGPHEKIQEKFKNAVDVVADKACYDESWMTDEPVQPTSAWPSRKVWEESMQQDTLIWCGHHLSIYAPSWEWLLDERMKMMAIASPHFRYEDMADAVDILRRISLKYDNVMKASHLKRWQSYIMPPIRNELYLRLNAAYERKYGVPGLLFS
ncbi:hypothetical protein KEM55_006137 [Ascosphaera atra]|nr:hypothetical protein KEM55_006137 [Ascosphaera atra]